MRSIQCTILVRRLVLKLVAVPQHSATKNHSLAAWSNYVSKSAQYKFYTMDHIEESQKKSNEASCSKTNSTNILIYSDIEAAGDDLENCVKNFVDSNRYTIYKVSNETLVNGAWRGRAALVIAVGTIGQTASSLLLQYLLEGGRLLVIHSNLLCKVLNYMDEFQEEIVTISYDKCQPIKLKQQILADAQRCSFNTSERYMGHPGHELVTQILALEDTWRTPSLLKVTDLSENGVAIFSQIYLELNPSEYLNIEGAKSNEVRLEIIRNVLRDLDLHLKDPQENGPVKYTKGYFLGKYESKVSLIKDLSSDNKCLKKIEDLTLQWCSKGDLPIELPSKSFLPVCIDEHPEDFSTEEYFDNLTSKHLGRLLIYSEVLSSTTNVIKDPLAHGLAVVARRQLVGRGRGGNAWITPLGQAAISLQVWQKMCPSLPLIQHASALAVVLAICTEPYQKLNIRIKWPNDVYYGRDIKIGGVITTANCMGDDVIVNIGTGVNISNKVPTTCVNDIILEYNEKNNTNLPSISLESFLARYCSELERILDYMAKDNGIEVFLKQYYSHWLHSGEEIRVQSKDSSIVQGTILGIDSAGWLVVKTPSAEVTVAPDGNSFDMMSGLVAPKF